MKRWMFASGGTAILSLLLGCGMYYGRVGGTAHDKLYRGSPEEVGIAVTAALAHHGYNTAPPESAGETLSISGKIAPEESVSVRIRPGKEGLAEVQVGLDIDWRKAVEIHRWIALELGVLYRRER